MKDELGRFPLHLAVKSGDYRMVNLLINSGAKLNVEDNLYGSTPLHYAAFYHYKKILKLLLARGAFVNVADSNGNFPLHLAAGNGCWESVRLLILHKASLDCLNKKLQTPLHLLAYAGRDKSEFPFSSNKVKDYLDSVKALAENGASDKIRDINDKTAGEIAFLSKPFYGYAQKFSQILLKR
jgi:ankyrin repeat protein